MKQRLIALVVSLAVASAGCASTRPPSAALVTSPVQATDVDPALMASYVRQLPLGSQRSRHARGWPRDPRHAHENGRRSTRRSEAHAYSRDTVADPAPARACGGVGETQRRSRAGHRHRRRRRGRRSSRRAADSCGDLRRQLRTDVATGIEDVRRSASAIPTADRAGIFPAPS